MGRVFDWIVRSGGVERMEEMAKAKSHTIYNVINQSNGFYVCPVNANCRSRMNIPFRINGGDEKLEQEFLSGAQKLGMIQLKGHRYIFPIVKQVEIQRMRIDYLELLLSFFQICRWHQSIIIQCCDTRGNQSFG